MTIVHSGALSLTLLACASMAVAPPAAAADKPDYAQWADRMRAHFDRHVLKTWFPASVDVQRGGFNSNLNRDWSPNPNAKADRFLVFQSRMTWLAAQVAVRRPEHREQFLGYTRHGVKMLRRMWDDEQGGFYWGLDADAKVTPQYGTDKCAYGISFGIYAAAAAHRATGDADALDLATKAFKWFDDHAHDAANGGYHEVLKRDGTPILPADLSNTVQNKVGYPNRVLGYKSMNSHIHLLEAFTELYTAKKDDAVRKRLEELFLIVRDKVAVEPGCLNLYFTPDWRAVPDHDSIGHDIETTYLLMEAAEALGPPHAHDPKTLKVARQLTDHALDWGFDKRRGGFYDKAAAFDPAHDTAKVWWTQAEGLNALLLLHKTYGHQTDRYWKAFELSWKFVNDHMADPEQGGWYERVAADGTVEKPGKASNWKAGYHDGRALMNMEAMFREMK